MASQQRIELRRKPSELLWGLFLIGLVLIAYARVSHAGFIWDDESHLTRRTRSLLGRRPEEIWTSPQAVYYPLVLTTFWACTRSSA